MKIESRLLAILFLATCMGCAREAPPADVSAEGAQESAIAYSVDPAISESEQRLEQLSEVVRELRDANAQLMFPDEAAFHAAVRQRYPAQDPRQDMLLDGWGRPFVYTLSDANRSYRLHSMGPNGTDERGSGDDAPSRSGTTQIQ